MNKTTAGADISIVIPCYNRQSLIKLAINSAIENGEGSEIIVIDDGSTDSSWIRIKSYGDTIRSYRTANNGVSAARNFGISKSKKPYIKFLDSDDILPPGAIAALRKAQHDADENTIVFGDAISIDNDGNTISPYGYGYVNIAQPGPISIAQLLSATMSPLLPLFPMSWLDQVDGFNASYSLGEDQDLALRMAIKGAVFVRIPFVVAQIREHEEFRLSRSDPEKLYEKHIILYEGLIHHLKEASKNDVHVIEALSRQALISARDAARQKVRRSAMRLFHLALQWSHVDPVPPYLRFAYKTLGPYQTEQCLTRLKTVLSYLKSFSINRNES